MAENRYEYIRTEILAPGKNESRETCPSVHAFPRAVRRQCNSGGKACRFATANTKKKKKKRYVGVGVCLVSDIFSGRFIRKKCTTPVSAQEVGNIMRKPVSDTEKPVSDRCGGPTNQRAPRIASNSAN